MIRIILTAALLPATAAGPGFDCRKAHTAVEKAVCASDAVSELDARLLKAYRGKLEALDAAGRSALRAEQREWLRLRDRACGFAGAWGAPLSKRAGAKAECLAQLYGAQLKQLEQPAAFPYLAIYSQNNGFAIFEDERIGPALEKLVGDYYDHFEESMQRIQLYETDEDGFGAWSFPGGVDGLYAVMEGIVLLEPGGGIWAAVLEGAAEDAEPAGAPRVLYFTNRDAWRRKLPKTIKTWLLTPDGKPRLTGEVVYMSAEGKAAP